MLVSKSPMLFLHITGLAISVGLVFFLDLRLLRLLFGHPVSRSDLEVMYFAQPIIRLGLVLLWVSGVGFLLHYWAYEPHLLENPKVHAKILVTIVLTCNGVLIDHFAFNHLRQQLGLPLFAGVSLRREAFLLGLGAVSATSWQLPIALGAIKELNFAVSASDILVAYVILIFLAFMSLLAIRHFLHRPHLKADYFARV